MLSRYTEEKEAVRMTNSQHSALLPMEKRSASPPPAGPAAEANLWKPAMTRIVWGIGLTTMTLNFWYLNYLLPAFGVMLLALGFRTLRRENCWFTVCWWISCCDLAVFFLNRVLDATIWSDIPLPLSAGPMLLGLVQSFCLWQGIRAVRRAAGQEDRAGAAGALLVFQTLLGGISLLSGGTLQLNGLLFAAVFLIIYIFILRGLSRLPSLMDAADYAVQASPTRLPEGAAWLGWFALLSAGILLAGALFCRYPMEWSPVEAGERQGLEAVRDNLLELGMPEQVADDLAPEDLAQLEGALSVTAQVHAEPINYGRQVRTTSGTHTQVSTVYDVKELRLSDIAVELPGGHWRIIHHFLWQEDPGLRTTECIKLWPAAQDRLEGWQQEGELTGRLLYDWAGTTYTGDYYRITTEHYTSSSLFWGETENTDPFALFSLPRQGERCRGYLTYGIQTVEEGWIIDSWSNYTHQIRLLNYPAMTAQEFDMSGLWRGAFETAQTAIQFNPWDGTEKGSYQEW